MRARREYYNSRVSRGMWLTQPGEHALAVANWSGHILARTIRHADQCESVLLQIDYADGMSEVFEFTAGHFRSLEWVDTMLPLVAETYANGPDRYQVLEAITKRGIGVEVDDSAFAELRISTENELCRNLRYRETSNV